MSNTIIAADIGTSSLKAALVDDTGVVLATARQGYGTRVSPQGWTEQDPADWLRALIEALQTLGQKLSLANAKGLVFTGQMSAGLIVDRAFDPLRPCIIWSDQRAEKEAKSASDTAGADRLYAVTGNPATATYTAPKLAWLHRNEPHLMRQAHAFIQPKDWIVAKLTGRLATDLSDASCTGLIDLRKGGWANDLLALYGIDERLAPEILSSTTIAGPLSQDMATLLGLSAGLPVVMGGGDGPADSRWRRCPSSRGCLCGPRDQCLDFLHLRRSRRRCGSASGNVCAYYSRSLRRDGIDAGGRRLHRMGCQAPGQIAT